MSEELITFGELRKIQKKEKREDELTDLSQNFMLNVSEYFNSKEETEGKSREYRNAERVLEKIISIREDKIVRAAKISANADNGSPENLLAFENELFRQLRNAFNEHREILEKKKKGNGIDVDKPEIEKETKEENQKTDGEAESEGYVNIEILSEVPEFMGTDLESYGPFEKGEEVKIPEENAEILINRGNAEEIQ